jgi:hypothetical protein
MVEVMDRMEPTGLPMENTEASMDMRKKSRRSRAQAQAQVAKRKRKQKQIMRVGQNDEMLCTVSRVAL